MRRVYLGDLASSRVELYTWPGGDLGNAVPRTLRRERVVPPLHGVGDAVVFGAGFAGDAFCREEKGNDAPCLLLAQRFRRLRDLLDDDARRRVGR